MSYEKKFQPIYFAINILNLQKYYFDKFFTLEYAILCEYMWVQNRRFNSKEFYRSAKTIHGETGISVKVIRRILKDMEINNLISITPKGFPIVNWFLVNSQEVEIFLKNNTRN